MVIKGLAKPSILKTYETERRSVAKELIAFDQEYSRLWSSRPKKDTKDQDGVSMAEFERAFVRQQLFSSGFGVHYGPSVLTAKASSGATDASGNGAGRACSNEASIASSHQHLASKTILGQRFPSFKVINHSDARTWHVANWLKFDGLFHVVLFAGDVSQLKQMVRVRNFATEMASRSDTIPLKREQRQLPSKLYNAYPGLSAKERGGIARLLTIHSAPRHAVEIHDFPPLLLPYDENLGYGYSCIFVDGESYYEGHGRAYKGYGIDSIRGCVIFVRPDQHVAWIGELEDVQGLEHYFAAFLESPKAC